jgi:methyl-accepting chemotaxis protein
MFLLARFSVFAKISAVIMLIGTMVFGGIWFAIDRMIQTNDGYSRFLSKDAQAWVTASRVNRGAFQLRYLVNRILVERNIDGRLKLEAEFNAAFDETAGFLTLIKQMAPKFATRADDLAAKARALRDAFTPMVRAAVAQQDDQARDILERNLHLFADYSAGNTQLRIDLDQAIQKGADDLNEGANATIRLTWAVMSTILAVGFLLAFLVSRFGITSPLRSLIDGLNKLARGEDIEIDGTERKEEIGETARAVNSIRTMLAEKAEREAMQKAEQDRQATAQREAALAKIADEFQAVVGSIVEAAVAGDFSQRVALEGKNGLVLNIGTSINTLCENVEKALNNLVEMLSALADGDLTQRITGEYQGSFATLKDNANITAERIGRTIAEIKHAAHEVTNASTEIATSTTDLSQRTEEQAASLEQSSASMQEISVTVKKNAENAQQANKSASVTREIADRGGQVVAKAIEAMARIEESSRKISDIIGVIDEIARQTNLLALNAAVEAARAGDAGRGFAVVASEVRSLAQRSAQAAKDIKNLITSSSSQVQEGVGLVNEAGLALTGIVESITSVAQIVAGIADASVEQSTGIEQVNKALAQMDEVTQQNSALVEENAATAKTLEHQSTAMDERVGFFRVEAEAEGRTKGSTGVLRGQKPQNPAQRAVRM